MTINTRSCIPAGVFAFIYNFNGYYVFLSCWLTVRCYVYSERGVSVDIIIRLLSIDPYFRKESSLPRAAAQKQLHNRAWQTALPTYEFSFESFLSLIIDNHYKSYFHCSSAKFQLSWTNCTVRSSYLYLFFLYPFFPPTYFSISTRASTKPGMDKAL